MTDKPARWRLLRSGAGEPAWNLALDDALLALAEPGTAPTLRLYAWRPHGLSLGRFQDAADVPSEFSPAETWTLVRRQTGGGAIHHANEITYSVVIPRGDALLPRDPMEGYSRFHEPLVGALATLGATARARGEVGGPPHPRPRSFFCFEQTSACDVVDANESKILGSAQRHTRRGFLQHGSLPLVGAAGARRGATSLSDACNRIVSFAEAEAAIVDAFRAVFEIVFAEETPDDAESRLACERVAARYGNDEWTLRGGSRSPSSSRRELEA